MQRNAVSCRQLIARGVISAIVVASVLAATNVQASAEQSSAARPAPARKMSYREVRQGLFGLSKFTAAPIVMLGDSITEAGPWDELTGCRQIVNRGIGGDTAARVLARLDQVLGLQPQAVFLMVGVNDISLRIPAETTAKSIADILDRLNGRKVHTFVQYVLPVTASYSRKRMNEEISALNATIAGLVAGRPDTAPVDLRPLVRRADGALRDEFSWDGIHLGPKAYEVWRDAIAPEIAKYCTP